MTSPWLEMCQRKVEQEAPSCRCTAHKVVLQLLSSGFPVYRMIAQSAAVCTQERMEFLEEDLSHLFDERGLDQSQYDNSVKFMDPLTKFNSVKGK